MINPAPRPFVLVRHQDVSGVSGTGVVAEGVVWSDGSASLHWFGPYSSVTLWRTGIEAIEAVHGHGGSTQIRYLDDVATPGPLITPADGTGSGDADPIGGRAQRRGDHDDVGGFCSCCGSVTPCSAMRGRPGRVAEVGSW
jgi:hypothetical protein